MADRKALAQAVLAYWAQEAGKGYSGSAMGTVDAVLDALAEDPHESWPIALQSVFGYEFQAPDEFVEWAEKQSLSWISPHRSLPGHSDAANPPG